MVNGEKYISGILHLDAFNGIKFADIPGSCPGPVDTAVVFWAGVGLPANNPTIAIIGYPGGKAASGTDGNGNISVIGTFSAINDNGKDFNLAGIGAITLPDGFLATLARIDINTTDGTREYYIQFSCLDVTNPAEFPGVPPPPEIPDAPIAVLLNPTTGETAVTIESNTVLSTDEDVMVIERSKNGGSFEVIGTTPKNSNGVTFPNYKFTDYLSTNGLNIGTGAYRYRARALKYSPSRTITAFSPNSNEITFTDVVPNIEVPGLGGTGTGGIDFGGSATIVLIADPSGIYTLVPDKTHDTLYERSGSVTTIEAKIPDPYVRTGFIE